MKAHSDANLIHSNDTSPNDAGQTMENDHTDQNKKHAKQVTNKKKGSFGKNSSAYWAQRIQRPRNSRGEVSPHYNMRIQFQGRRLSFTLRSGNKDAAAKTAAAIYNDLIVLGVEATTEKYRATSPPDRVASVGEWIAAAREVSSASPATLQGYSVSLRKIAGDVLNLKRTPQRFGPKGGGAKDFRAKIDAASLEILTPKALQKWRLEKVKKGSTPLEQASRKTTSNSTVRQAASLFSEKIVSLLTDLKLPDPRPFEGVQYFPKQNHKYFSRIDAKDLMKSAHETIGETDQPAFLIILLAISAGLRRAEIDSLQWSQIDFQHKLIRLEHTDSAALKSAESRAEVHPDPGIFPLLQGYKAKATGKFVIEGLELDKNPKSWGRYYRNESVFKRVTKWLRNYEVDGETPLKNIQKPLHELRKELGALITEAHGIYAASRVLRHSSPTTTSAHYADLKNPPAIAVSDWLVPENVIELEKEA